MVELEPTSNSGLRQPGDKIVRIALVALERAAQVRWKHIAQMLC
jgi:hypothetical protein